MAKRLLVLNALRISQRPDVPIYVFGLNGRLIHEIAAVHYADRGDNGKLEGYQRKAVKAHINEIYAYLSSEKPLLPNAIVLALEDGVSFEALPGYIASEWGTFGKLKLPLPQKLDDKKPAWIVDGQQRAMALSRLDPTVDFPVAIVAFQSQHRELQREQFLLVNRTKPLPRDLMHEILPEVSAVLPKTLRRRRSAATVLKELRWNVDSPFFGRIRGLGSEEDETANISQAAILDVIQNSVRTRGALFGYTGDSDRYDAKKMAAVVSVFFDGVRKTWPQAWDASPKFSRLVHGVGIVGMGAVMDKLMPGLDVGAARASLSVANRLEPLVRQCAWTRGRWPTLGCAWNELQNTSQDKARLSDFLVKAFVRGSA